MKKNWRNMGFIKSCWSKYVCDHSKFWIFFLVVACLPFIFTREAFLFGFTESSGYIGDTIGGTTAPAIGLISIYLLYKTLRSQINFNNEQIKFNKEQLEYNKEQKKLAFDEQFKSTLFNLLETQRELGNSISALSKAGSSGNTYFSTSRNELINIFEVLDNEYYYSKQLFENIERNRYSSSPTVETHESFQRISRLRRITTEYKIGDTYYSKYNELETIAKKVAWGYILFYSKNTVVRGYFRHFYHILKFIDTTRKESVDLFYEGVEPISHKEKYINYAQFLQAQMTMDELFLVFYDSFLFPKLQSLLIEYNVLENLSIEYLVKKSHNCIADFHLKSVRSLFLDVLRPELKDENSKTSG